MIGNKRGKFDGGGIELLQKRVEVIKTLLTEFADIAIEENEKLTSRVISNEEKAAYVIDRIVEQQNEKIKNANNKVELSLRGMAKRLEDVEKSIDKLQTRQKSHSTASIGVGIGTNSEDRQKLQQYQFSVADKNLRHHDEILKKHASAIGNFNEVLQNLEQRIFVNSDTMRKHKQSTTDVISDICSSLKNVRSEVDANKTQFDYLQGCIEQIREDSKVVKIKEKDVDSYKPINSFESKVFHIISKHEQLDQKMENLEVTLVKLQKQIEQQNRKHLQEIELLFKSVEASSHLHQQQQQQYEKILMANAQFERKVKEMGKYMEQRDIRNGDILDEQVTNMQNIKQAIQVIAKEVENGNL